MYYQYPIEQVATSTQTRYQNGFARMATYLLPRLEDIVYEPSSLGLKILAGDECALATPAEILQQVYGEDVRLTSPRVRLLRDVAGIKEPVMNVRVQVRLSDVHAVVDDLARRDAVTQEVDYQSSSAVIRAQATLRKLLRYQQAVAAMTDNTAEVWLWLSHYSLVGSGPEGAAT